MKGQTQRGKLLSIVLIVLMTINLLSPVALATEGVSEKVEAKPLIIMMEYQDYKFSDIDTKEKDWRLRGIPGNEYTPAFVQELLFGKEYYTGENGQQFMSVRKYFDVVTAGNYSFNGKVVGPYTASKNAAWYGSDRNGNGSDQDEAMLLVREAIQAVAKDPTVDLSEFDVENRIGDGEFGIPDGVIDTVIVIHPGIGEEWKRGSLEGDAIWPFRRGFSWYLETNFKMEKAVDKKSKEWLFDDFVLIAQDSASDMLIHEYGHVLGLPDLYGFIESTPPVKWWCNMGGSYSGKDIAGTMPNSYGAYCREFLQKSFEDRKVKNPKWANYQKEDFSDIGKDGLNLELHQSHERLDGRTDLFRMDLPRKETIITTPNSGKYAYFSGKDNDSRSFMKTTVDLTNYEKVKLEFKTWYKIDPYFDFATVRVNEVGKPGFETVEGNITTTKFDPWLMKNETEEERLERNPGYGITDDSDGWIDAIFDLSKYAGKNIELKFYFWTDTNTPEEGIYIDDIVITGVTSPGGIQATILEDDVEGDLKFVINDGFKKSTGKIDSEHYYLLEWRNIEKGKVDEGLGHVFYEWPEVGYDPGLLVWYINEMWTDAHGRPDQQVADHPGECFAGVVDADQNPVGYDKAGKYYNDKRVDFNMHDAAFSLRMENKFSHNWSSGTVTKDIFPFMVPEFDDNKDYTNPINAQAGLKLPNYGIKILVTEEASDRSSAKVHIMNSELKNNLVDYSDGLNVKDIKIENNVLSIKAENKGVIDNLGEKAYIGYIKKKVTGSAIEAKEVLVLENGVYKCSTDFLTKVEKGTYQINFIVLEDAEGNARAIYNSKVHSGYGMDLSIGNISTDSSVKPKNPNNPANEIKEKIEINMDSDVLSINIDPKIIESIVKNKKDLIISSKDFTLTINPDIFEKNKEYPITLNIVKKNTIRGGEYIQASPSIQLGLSIKKGDKVENLKLDKKTTISIKYNDKNGLNYEKACIYRVDENSNLIFIGGKLNRDSKTIECEIDSLGVFEVLIYNKSFKDVDMAWAKDAIEVLASRHIVNGVDKDNFKPYENITRAEFCKILISTLNIELKDSTFEFKDVDKDKWYYEYINAAAGLGLVEGYDGMFKPDDLITREAMIVMILRAAKLEKYGQSNVNGDLNFDDSESISDWSKEAVLFAKNNGIVQGVGDNRLEPKKNATRAETAVIIYKILKLKGIF